MIYIFRLIWAIIWIIICGIIDVINFILTFKIIFGLSNSKAGFIKAIDTLGEYGEWKSRFHWH